MEIRLLFKTNEVGVMGKSPDELVQQGLQSLGVTVLSEWDALVFLYHHSASLDTVAEIARLIGRDKGEVAAALQKLETLGLIQRSRISQGIRLYEFLTPPEPSVRHSSLRDLMSLAHNRLGRLLLVKHLRGPLHQPRRRRDSGLRLA
ncbi:MAG TPA: helix-turn-helix domain-containing protein [Candidatus Acidoferrales bacterium]|nr:helix-turn-helix domain-containing protein [Candidatus Acidoferrales bacterium]